MNDVCIYVASHKDVLFSDNELYRPLQVGASLSEVHFTGDYVHDDEGDNISIKNHSYCELTAIYWIWKNCRERWVGLTHYRRYFARNHFDALRNRRLDYAIVKEVMDNCDAILPERELLDASVKYDFAQYHYEKDWILVSEIISTYHPEYNEAFEIVSSSNRMSKFNMIIAKKEIFDAYCQWLFDVLSELERVLDLSEYDYYQRRVFGFIAERLLNVWFVKNSDVRVKHLPVYCTDVSVKDILVKNLYHIAKYVFRIDVYFFQKQRKLRLITEHGSV